MRRRTIEYVLLALIAVGLIGTGFALAGGAGDSGKTKIATIRPTGVGLPRIGMHGTVGAGDVVAPLKQYHDSGHYQSDLEKVGDKAQDYLDRRVAKIRKQAKQRCNSRAAAANDARPNTRTRRSPARLTERSRPSPSGPRP